MKNVSLYPPKNSQIKYTHSPQTLKANLQYLAGFTVFIINLLLSPDLFPFSYLLS